MREHLKTLREQRGMSRATMAKRLGITHSYYGMIEAGTRKTTLDIAQRIATLLDSTVEELFGGQASEAAA